MTAAPKRRWLLGRMQKQKQSVWIVIICEIAGPEDCVLDTVLLVASSLKAAEAEVRRGWTAPFSWYRVERRFLDDTDSDAREVRFYSHKGRPQKKAPQGRARFHFRQFLNRLLKAEAMMSIRALQLMANNLFQSGR